MTCLMPPVKPETEELKKQLNKTRKNYAYFVSLIAETKYSIIQQHTNSLISALRLRSNLYSLEFVIGGQFHDLLRYSIITYILDHSKNQRNLYYNLIALEQFILKYPRQKTPVFRFKDIVSNCGQLDKDINCFVVKANHNWMKVTFDENNREFNKIPLYILEPTKTEYFLPHFGIKPKIIDIYCFI
jgi:hypothetical protein